MLMEKYIEMPRLNAVWNHPLYQKYYRENEKMEHDREGMVLRRAHIVRPFLLPVDRGKMWVFICPAVRNGNRRQCHNIVFTQMQC